MSVERVYVARLTRYEAALIVLALIVMGGAEADVLARKLGAQFSKGLTK